MDDATRKKEARLEYQRQRRRIPNQIRRIVEIISWDRLYPEHLDSSEARARISAKLLLAADMIEAWEQIHPSQHYGKARYNAAVEAFLGFDPEWRIRRGGVE